MVEDNFPGSEVIYGDTDSIFINFHIKNENGEEQTDRDALIKTIAKCQRAAKLINQYVPKPQSIIYEKTFHPFILVTKKKYVGLLFEKNPDKYYLKSMGIVLKRRDNAPIVKIVVGGIIDHILKHRDIDGAIEYTKIVLRKLMNGEYPIDKFIISKTLRARYKKPSSIAHKVLADRMALRDPGNRPQINDRIPYVYVIRNHGKKKKKDILQGDLIEHPDYVLEHGLSIDYLYYLEHQIINPASQILELMLDQRTVEKMFNEFIIGEINRRNGAQSIINWIDPKELHDTIQKDSQKSRSKTPKEPRRSSKLDPKLEQIIKTKRHDCQNMKKWMDFEPESKSKKFSSPGRSSGSGSSNKSSGSSGSGSSNRSLGSLGSPRSPSFRDSIKMELPKRKIDPKIQNLIKSKQHDCQNMNKWLREDSTDNDHWQPGLD